MPKNRVPLRIDAPALDNTGNAAAVGEVFDYIDSPAPPALSIIEAPGAPTLTTFLSRSAGTPTAIVSATWTPPDGLDTANLTYLIQWSVDSTFATGTNGATALTAGASIDFLATGTLYYFRVAAIYRSIQGPYSASISITTAVDTTAPAVPTAVAWSWAANGDLDVTWTDPVSANLKLVEVLIWNSSGKTVFYRGLATAPGLGRARWTVAMNSQDTATAFDAAVYIEVRSLSWGGIYSATNAVPGTQPTKAVPGTPTSLTSSWASDTGIAGGDCVITWAAQADSIKFRLTVDGVVRELADNTYTYTFATNRAEHSNTPDPVLTISLVAVDGLNQASTAATLTATNTAPATSSATLFGGYSTIGIAITGSGAADVLNYTVRVILNTVTAATYTTNDVNQIYSATAAGSYQIGIKVNDLFGQASSETVSGAVVIDALTIAELRANASYVDDLGTAAATLNTLKDAVTSSGGLAIASGIATTWHWITASRAELDRYLTMTISASAGVGYIGVSADNVTFSWYSGPLLADGRTLTAVASEAAAQTAAIALPVSAGIMRWELPAMKEGRFIKLGHKNTSAVAYSVYEFYPRRLIEGDDIRGESITGINIKAATITGDRLVATAIDAFTITGATLQTATSGARVVLSGNTNGGIIGYSATDTYNVATGAGTYQLLWNKADGKLYAGGGVVVLSSAGIKFDAASTSQTEITWASSGITAISMNGFYDGANNASYGYLVNGVGWTGASKYGQLMLRASGRTPGSFSGNKALYIGYGVDPAGLYTNGYFFTDFDNSVPVTTTYASITSAGLSLSGSAYHISWDNPNARYVTDANFYALGQLVAGGDIYWGTGGNYLSAYLNQAVKTTSNPFFNQVNVSSGTLGNASYFGYAAPSIYLGNGVNSAASNQNFIIALATGAGHYIAGTASGDGILMTNGSGGAGNIFLAPNSAIALNIASATGNVAIGLASTLSSTARLAVRGIDSSTTNYSIVAQNSGATNIMRLRNDGGRNESIIAWTITSDRRLKENIAPVGYGLAAVLQLAPVRFDYITGGKDQLGFIAQEVEPIIPEVVSQNEAGFYGMQKENLIPVLVQAIQDLVAQHAAAILLLSNRIADLEAPNRKRQAA